MVYLIGKIKKIGGISGKRVYLKELRGICLWGNTFLRDGESQDSFSCFIYGSTHCFNCLVSLIEKALSFHNNESFVIVQLQNDLVTLMEEIDDKFLEKFAERDSSREIRFDNKLIEEIAKSVLK